MMRVSFNSEKEGMNQFLRKAKNNFVGEVE